MKKNKNYINLSIGLGILVIATLVTYLLRAIVEYNNLPKPPDIQKIILDTINPMLPHL